MKNIIGKINEKLYSFCGESEFDGTYSNKKDDFIPLCCGYAVKWGNYYPYAIKIKNPNKLGKCITTKKYKKFFEVELRKIAKTNKRDFCKILQSGYTLFPEDYKYDNIIKNKDFKTYKDLYKIRKQMILKNKFKV
jgi:hypothetical protein